MAAFLLPILVQLAIVPAGADQSPVSQAALDAIAQRGQALEAYNRAVFNSIVVAQAAVNYNPSGQTYFVAQKTASGWVVDFGMLDGAGTTFLTRVEASSLDGETFTAHAFAPARRDTGFLVAAAHAIATAWSAFKPVSGYYYNATVVPNADKMLYVYLYPAQTKAKIFLAGGDERFTISTDGRKILDAHPMHRNVLAIPSGVAEDQTVDVADVPQDTDVFYVLARKPPHSAYVNARGQRYLIAVDGSITYVGAAQIIPNR